MLNLREKWNKIPITVKASTSYAICNILQKCLSFFTLPLFTHLLTKEQYGQYTVYSSWLGIFSIVLTLNLAYGSFSTAMVKFENKRDEYISSIEGICLALAGGFLFIYLPFSGFWNGILEMPTFLVLFMVAEIICSTAVQLWSGKKRFQFKYISVVVLTLITSVVAPVVATLLIFNTNEKGYARIIGYSIVTIATGGAILFLNLYRGKRLFNKEFWKYALRFNIPLLAYYFSQVVFNQSDRIMISHMCGNDKAAVYGVAYNLATVLMFVLNAINSTYVPWLYGKIKDEKTVDNQRVSSAIAILMSVLLLAVIWFGPEIILIMAGTQYIESVWVVAPVAMSVLLLLYSQFFINIEFYYEEKSQLVFSSIGAAIINIVLNYLLIPYFGYVAAGYTTLISYIIFAISNYSSMKKILKSRGVDDDLYNYKNLATILILFIVAGFLGTILYDLLWIRILIAAIVLLILIINRKKMLSVLSTIKKN